MKHLLLILLLLLTVPALAQESSKGSEPPKKANAILITTTDSAGLAWRRIRETLLAQGYGLGQSDKEVRSFGTLPKPVKAGRTLTITGFVKTEAGETVISLSGSYLLVTSSYSYTRGQTEVTRQAAWKGGALGNDSAMFTLVEQVAKSYPNQSKPLSYTIR